MKLNEVVKKRVVITKGPFKGAIGTVVFSRVPDSDLRYYVVELDNAINDTEVVIVTNGEYDWYDK